MSRNKACFVLLIWLNNSTVIPMKICCPTFPLSSLSPVKQCSCLAYYAKKRGY